MSAIEIIEFASRPGTTADQLHEALDALDALDVELVAIGGFQSKELFRDADADDRWLLVYRWDSADAAKESMGKVADSVVFVNLMALVDAPESMRMSYGKATSE